jgi:hypothetical protein
MLPLELPQYRDFADRHGMVTRDLFARYAAGFDGFESSEHQDLFSPALLSLTRCAATAFGCTRISKAGC